MAFRLTLLGPPRLLDDQGGLVPIPAKAFALAAHILLAGGGAPVSRAALRQFLWDTPDAKTAATNLRKFLLRIRQRQKEAGFELIHEERDHVRLAQSVEIDLAQFQQIVAVQRPDDVRALCDIYRGELLEGFAWEEPEAREWLEVQRAKIRDAFVTAVSNWIESAGPETDGMSQRIVARRLVEVDPYNEIGYRTLMRLFSEGKEPARVREVYRTLQERLRADLGVEPDAATAELYRDLLPSSDPLAAVSPAASMPTLPAEPKAAEHRATPVNVPLPATVKPTGAPRITILPPLQSGGQDFHYQLASSLIEDITIGLCRFKSLSVVAPHTASQLNGSNKRSLLESYNIAYAAETRLLNRGGECWLSVKLMDAVNRDIMWTEQYAFSDGQMARRYAELSVKIARSLVDRVERNELSRYDSEQDPTAYHHYLAGQRHLRALDLPNARRARRAFKSALGASPEFVPAIAGLARTYQLEWLLMARGDNDLLAEGERLARMSVEIDPDDARGHRELGICSLFAGRFDESLEALARGEACNPQYADLVSDFADALTHACDPAAALTKITHAIELNPLCPDHYWWTSGGSNFHLRQYREAIEAMSHMSDRSPAYRLLAASWAMLGEREQAAEYVKKATEIHPDFSVNGWISILPIRDASFAQHYEQSLREAGFE